MGLQQEIFVTARVPSWLVQYRLRVKLEAFLSETQMSLFLGRPPRLSTRYFRLGQMPALLTNEELVQEEEQVQQAIQECSRGPPVWERRLEVQLMPGAIIIRLPVILLKEKVLEMCLGNPAVCPDIRETAT